MIKKLKEYQVRLLDAAEKAMRNSYAPYSRFNVGAALLANDGTIVVGTNYEDATTRTGTCAERAALFNANTQGLRRLRALAIIGKGSDFRTKSFIAPCGVCRQSLYEASQISGVDLEIIMSNTDRSKISVMKISQLLPLPFGPRDVGVNTRKFRR